MIRPQLLVIAASVMLAHAAPSALAAAAKSAPAAAVSAQNPLLKVSPLPFQMPQFGLIKDEHYAPAFAEGMKRQLAEVNAIANNRQPATFENTIVALERTGQLLHRVQSIFSNMTSTNTNSVLEAVEVDVSPKLAAHGDAITLNPKLFTRIDTLYAKRDKLGLDAESLRLLERYHTDFVRAGARLSDADKEKLKAYNAEQAGLETAFAQNVLKETNAKSIVVDTRAELAGMTDSDIDTAATAAKERGLTGKFVIALVNTSGQPPLAVLTDRKTRQRLMDASLNRGSQGGEFDNRAIVLKLAKLRAERATLLGYANYAAYALEDQTAKTTTAVNTLLSELAKPAVANARREAADLQQVVDAEKGGFQVAAADWAIYTDKLRKQRFNFDENELKPYLELNSVLNNGVFFAANKLYGISFKQRTDLPV